MSVQLLTVSATLDVLMAIKISQASRGIHRRGCLSPSSTVGMPGTAVFLVWRMGAMGRPGSTQADGITRSAAAGISKQLLVCGPGARRVSCYMGVPVHSGLSPRLFNGSLGSASHTIRHVRIAHRTSAHRRSGDMKMIPLGEEHLGFYPYYAAIRYIRRPQLEHL